MNFLSDLTVISANPYFLSSLSLSYKIYLALKNSHFQPLYIKRNVNVDIIGLPDELLEKIGWKIGDEIEITHDEADNIRSVKLNM
jgi:hypothetical protein